MVYSPDSVRVKELFLEYGFEYHVAAKAYAGWHAAQAWQMDFLVRNGLKPHHCFLDVGCGWLRLGQALIPYLERGRYFGIDSTQIHLDVGRRLLDAAHMAAEPTLLCDAEFQFARFGTRFDYAFCHAVFTHLGHDQIRQCIRNLVPVMQPGGRFFATFYLSGRDSEGVTRYRCESGDDLEYRMSLVSLPFLRRLFREVGLQWRYLGPQGHPTGQHVIEVRFGPWKPRSQGLLNGARRAAGRVRLAAQMLLAR